MEFIRSTFKDEIKDLQLKSSSLKDKLFFDAVLALADKHSISDVQVFLVVNESDENAIESVWLNENKAISENKQWQKMKPQKEFKIISVRAS